MFFIPFASSSLTFSRQFILFFPGKSQHLFDMLFFLDEGHQVFLWAKSGWTFSRLSRGKRSIDPVIIASRDRIKLMVMALRATQGRREKSLTHVVH